jgi:hypothetical protein
VLIPVLGALQEVEGLRQCRDLLWTKDDEHRWLAPIAAYWSSIADGFLAWSEGSVETAGRHLLEASRRLIDAKGRILQPEMRLAQWLWNAQRSPVVAVYVNAVAQYPGVLELPRIANWLRDVVSGSEARFLESGDVD